MPMPANAEEANDSHWQVRTSLSQLSHFHRPWSVFSLCQSGFYSVCPPSTSLFHLWVSWIRLQVLQELRAYCYQNTKHIIITWLVRSSAQYLMVNSFVDSALLCFSHLSFPATMCPWWGVWCVFGGPSSTPGSPLSLPVFPACCHLCM